MLKIGEHCTLDLRASSSQIQTMQFSATAGTLQQPCIHTSRSRHKESMMLSHQPVLTRLQKIGM